VFKGVHLTLMIGPAVPLPVSKTVLDALESVQVISRDSGPSGFELQFRIGVQSPLQTLFLVGGGVSIPLVRVVIAVTVNGETSVLIDGVMTDHTVSPDAHDGTTTVTIKGESLEVVMGYLELPGIPFPAMPAEAQVLLCLAKYAVFGIAPMVIPSPIVDIPIPTSQILRQQGTDLKHIRRLAKLVGYVFYLEPGPLLGTSVAYWGPRIKWGPVQPALGIDADASSNVEQLSFEFNNEGKSLPILVIQEPITKVPIPIPLPYVNPLSPPLGAVPPIPKHIPIINGVAKLPPARALMIGMAKQALAADAVTATGKLDVLRYGRVLSPRKLVGVRGAGTAFDGLWYVTSVTHDLKRGEYKQSFTLSRNGLVSTLPTVAV
jgi:hypothetical protein